METTDTKKKNCSKKGERRKCTWWKDPSVKERRDSFGIPNQIWEGIGNFQIRSALPPPKYNLESRPLASAIRLIPNAMNFSSEEKVALASVINPLKDMSSIFGSPQIQRNSFKKSLLVSSAKDTQGKPRCDSDVLLHYPCHCSLTTSTHPKLLSPSSPPFFFAFNLLELNITHSCWEKKGRKDYELV